MNNINYNRLLFLNEKVNSGNATKEEKDELMNLLYFNNSITQKQYDDYKAGRNRDELVRTALTIGGIVLLGYLIGKATE